MIKIFILVYFALALLSNINDSNGCEKIEPVSSYLSSIELLDRGDLCEVIGHVFVSGACPPAVRKELLASLSTFF